MKTKVNISKISGTYVITMYQDDKIISKVYGDEYKLLENEDSECIFYTLCVSLDDRMIANIWCDFVNEDKES